MHHFYVNPYGTPLKIVFNMIRNGRYWYNSDGRYIGVKFDHAGYPERDNEISLGSVDIAELDPEHRSYLWQCLELTDPEGTSSYS